MKKTASRLQEDAAARELVNNAGNDFIGFQLARAAFTITGAALVGISNKVANKSQRKKFYKMLAVLWIASAGLINY